MKQRWNNWSIKQQTWIIVAIMAFATIMVGAADGGSDSSSAPLVAASGAPAAVVKPASTPQPVAPQPVAPVIDATTVYNSGAHRFLAKYRRVYKDPKATLSNDTQNCHDTDDGHKLKCQFRVDIPIASDEGWSYRIDADNDTGCWTARLTPEFGPEQSSVDLYQDRDWLAPTKSELRRALRRVKKLQRLRGCVSKKRETLAGSTAAAKFMASLASQHVARKYPGEQKRTVCEDLGRDKMDFAPDANNFDCRTRMANGKLYADSISCFDEPPYNGYRTCTHEDGHPKLAPRPLPG